MNILWFSWKDISHPEAGGAETVSHEIMLRLVKDGHKVKLITSRYPNAEEQAIIDGIQIYRTGSRYSVYLKALLYYKKNLQNWEDIVIDEMNTIPFLSAIYTKPKKRILLAYQLARKVWFYQMIFPFSVIGYLLEPILLRITSSYYPLAVTESLSTKNDMGRYGFDKVNVFSIGMALKPTNGITTKKDLSTILSLGAIRPMKRTLEAIKAFEFARDKNSNLNMIIAGDDSSKYARKVKKYANNSRHREAIDIKGRVSAKERKHLMKKAAIILVTSIKEGWGLIVTEANSQGTPAIVYDVDGLRDSVQDRVTGIITPDRNPKLMADAIIKTLGSDTYETMRKNAHKKSKEYSFDSSYNSFLKATGINEIK